jgi:hypothetical protein
MIEIYDRVAVSNHFDEHPNESITVYVPASGSWCETFHSKEQYLKRMEAWDKALLGEQINPSWYDLRGDVTYSQ